METKTKTNKKQTKARQRVIIESDEEDMVTAVENEPKVMLTPIKRRSRASSIFSSIAADALKQKVATTEKKSKCLDGADEEGKGIPDGACLEAVTEERKELERFLLESNKINKPAIKFILEKWASMEASMASPECLGGESNLERDQKRGQTTA